MSLLHDLLTLLPELIVAVSAMALLLAGAVVGNERTNFISRLAVLAMLVAGWFVATSSGTLSAFHAAFVVDGFSRFVKLLILGGSAISIVLAGPFFANEKQTRFELPVLILLASLGMMLMVSATSFIALYMGLELQSLALYVLAAFNRDSLRSTEAGLKYFVLGALSSGMLLYGISLIYGFTGTTGFAGIQHAIAQSGVGLGLVFGLVFLTAGLAFKVGAVPFHMWTPDVYEGSPTPITAYFTTAAKVAAFALFIRAVMVPFPQAIEQWRQIIIVISVLSTALGAIAAIGQNNIKRLMAYSSIGHVGYALLGLAAGTVMGVQGMLIYLAYYLVTNLGVFACILAMKRNGEMVEEISELSGLARTQPVFAFAMAALMLSLAGLPPLAGIVAKIYVFMAAMGTHLLPMYVAATINIVVSVIGAYYYLRIVKVMYFDEPAKPFDQRIGGGLSLIMGAATVFSILFFFLPAPLIDSASAAAATLFR
jgi:NADH-quinone oxidoreductase subunit N